MASFLASHQPSAKRTPGSTPGQQISTRPNRHKEGENTVPPETYHRPQPRPQSHDWPQSGPVIVSACGEQLTRSGRRSITSIVLQSHRGSNSQSSQPLALVRGARSRRRPVKLLCKYHPQTFCYFGSLHVFGTPSLHLPTRRRRVCPRPRCMQIPDRSGCPLVSSRSFIPLYPTRLGVFGLAAFFSISPLCTGTHSQS